MDTINPGTPWPATDASGRTLPLSNETGAPRAGRFVGVFYFLWLDLVGERYRRPEGDGPYDIAKILAADPDAAGKPDSPLWGPPGGTMHYWGEPLYGYYHSADPWVLRRHARLLSDAGVDVLIFDTTNTQTYFTTVRALGEAFCQVRKEGGRTPQIAYMVNTKAGETAEKIYMELYKPGLYRELWFHWEGKPLLLCDPAAASAEVRDFFTLRRAHWPFSMVNTDRAWHWEATYPQPYGYVDDPTRPEQVNVSVAQNLRRDTGVPTCMSSGEARGRSFHNGMIETAAGSVNGGYNVEEQWQRALELDPPFVMITGWNEWIAGRWGKADGPLEFVDQFDQEHSRDIEPMKGGHGDNYYWQMVANIRRYKGTPELPRAATTTTIDIEGGFEQWGAVESEFLNEAGRLIPRDWPGAAGLHYTNRTNRNEFASFKITHDQDMLYFYARCRDAISSSSDPNWMWLLINTRQEGHPTWAGYDFIVNRTLAGDGQSWLERNAGDWNWERVAPVRFRVEGHELHLAIPRTALSLAHSDGLPSFEFKWADNIQDPGDVMDFYLSGDVAPVGRFNYRYQ